MSGDNGITVSAADSAGDCGQHTFRKGFGGIRASFRAILLVSLLLAGAVGCDLAAPDSGPSPSATPVPPAATVPATATPTPAAATATASLTAENTTATSGLVLPVAVAPVPSALPEYDRGDWRHWIDEDRDCQNARQEALIAESLAAVEFESPDECRVVSGRWEGPYTGEIVSSPSELDIDHMVPLANAHRSGAWGWSRERKRAYANGLGYENHLIATISSANRSKGSKGPEEWRPPLESYWCVYAIDWATVKSDWGLTVTEAEYEALLEMLATCPMPVSLERADIEILRPTATPTPTASAAPTLPTPQPGLRYDPFGPDRNCGDFDTYEEARDFFLAAGGPAEDPHKLDSNGDGEPCESLPGGPSASESPMSPLAAVTFSSLIISAPAGANSGCAAANQQQTAQNYLPASLISATSEPDCQPTTIPRPTPTSRAVAPTPTPAPTPPPPPTAQPITDTQNCTDFATWEEAQAFYLSEGGPAADPHRLDANSDGVACQSLPGAPGNAAKSPTPMPAPTPVLTPTPEPSPTAEPITDTRSCGDFATWEEAQAFYLSEGGPAADPHRLDANSDGIACQSLPGVPGDAPSPTPVLTPTPEPSPTAEPITDTRSCGDFATWEEAQAFYLSEGGPAADPHRLDANSDGIACQSLPGVPGDAPSPTPVLTPTPEPSPTPEPPLVLPAFSGLSLDPYGPDRSCSDFASWWDAQNFFLAAGGPGSDPHRLDGNDNDGIVCESLLGAPRDDPEPPAPISEPSSSEDDFVDRNCDDFGTWRAAQDFFESEGGPDADPHGLEGNDNDGIVCESLPGAPRDDPDPTTPPPAPGPEVAFEDHNCDDFGTWRAAQDFFESEGGPDADPHGLEGNDNDGIVCESLPGAPRDDPEPPAPISEPSSSEDDFVDRNCDDFETWRAAQNFFESEGGPNDDPHGLDANSDGVACQSLPGAPGDAPSPTPLLTPTPEPPPTAEPIADTQNCTDFATWEEAQAFYLSEGGPDSDPHRLDGNGDGVVCESLPGAPDDNTG